MTAMSQEDQLIGKIIVLALIAFFLWGY